MASVLHNIVRALLNSFFVVILLIGSFGVAYAQEASTSFFAPQLSSDLFPSQIRAFNYMQRGLNMGDRVNYHMVGGGPVSYRFTPTETVFNDFGASLQQSHSASNIFMPSGHGSLGVPGFFFGEAHVPRDTGVKRIRNIADSVGKDVVFVDYSCGSGACLDPSVSEHVGGHLKGIITLAPAGKTGYTSQLEYLFEGVGWEFSNIDVNGDGAITLGEFEDFANSLQIWDFGEGKWLEESPFQFIGDRDHVLFYDKDHPGVPDRVCIVLPPGDDPEYSDAIRERMQSAEILRGTPPDLKPTLREHREREKAQERARRGDVEPGSGEDVEIYFYTPTEANLQQFIDTMPQAIYEINDLDVQVGHYPIGRTLLVNDRSGEQQQIHFKVVGDQECIAEEVEFSEMSDHFHRGDFFEKVIDGSFMEYFQLLLGESEGRPALGAFRGAFGGEGRFSSFANMITSALFGTPTGGR